MGGTQNGDVATVLEGGVEMTELAVNRRPLWDGTSKLHKCNKECNLSAQAALPKPQNLHSGENRENCNSLGLPGKLCRQVHFLIKNLDLGLATKDETRCFVRWHRSKF